MENNKKTGLDKYKDKQKRLDYNNELKKKKYKQFSIAFDKEKDAELIQALESSTNKADFIRQLFNK